jgi:hypothetical protein
MQTGVSSSYPSTISLLNSLCGDEELELLTAGTMILQDTY